MEKSENKCFSNKSFFVLKYAFNSFTLIDYYSFMYYKKMCLFNWIFKNSTQCYFSFIIK